MVFCPDPPGYGERAEPMPSEDSSFLPDQKKSSLASSCKDLAQTAEALGLSLTALKLWEMRCLLILHAPALRWRRMKRVIPE